MKSPAGIEIAGVTGVVEAIMMILVSEEWLFEAVLGLADAALAAAMI